MTPGLSKIVKKSAVVASYFYAAPGNNFDAAPAPSPAPTLLCTVQSRLFKTKHNIKLSL
jgi:hypothetical protein